MTWLKIFAQTKEITYISQPRLQTNTPSIQLKLYFEFKAKRLSCLVYLIKKLTLTLSETHEETIKRRKLLHYFDSKTCKAYSPQED